MTRLLKHILTVFIMLSAITDAVSAEVKGDSLQALVRQYSASMGKGDYSEALSSARKYGRLAAATGDSSRMMLAYSYIGQSFVAREEYDSAYFYLDRGLEIWDASDSLYRSKEQYYAIYAIYNGLGICSVNKEMNYGKAISYFLDGLRLAEKRSDYVNYAIFGANMVVTYNLRKDTTGLNYALEVYDVGKRMDDKYIIYYGSYITAMMYYLKGDIAKAKQYLDETMSLSGDFLDKRGMYSLYAQILAAEGNMTEAEEYFRLSVDNVSEESVLTAVSIYMTYAEFLMSMGRYDEASSMLDGGIELAVRKNNRAFTYRLYKMKSECYEHLRQPWKALEMYKKYNQESSEVYSLEQEREINELTRKYENERYEKELQQQKLTIIKRSRELQTALFTIVIVVAGLAAIFLMYHHKNTMYTRIVKQYKEAIAKQKGLEETILHYEEVSKGASSHTDDKNSELFIKLETLMRESKVYREKNLTRERVAEQMGTNRTYLSQVVNEKTGMSFIHYINSYRIEEALEILSEASNEIPLKALCSDLGFNSITTFYKLFQEKVGMTPAKYREKIIELSTGGN